MEVASLQRSNELFTGEVLLLSYAMTVPDVTLIIVCSEWP